MKFLLTTRTHWEEVPRSRHQVAKALSVNNEVYFLSANKIGFPKIKTQKINDNLTIFIPYWFVKSKIRFRIPIINELYQMWIFKKIKKITSDITVINFDHTFHLLNNYFNNTVYYCSDEFIGNGKFSNFFINSYHRYCEKKVSENSKICIATTSSLLDKLKQIHKNTFEINLGTPTIADINKYTQFNRDPGRKIRVGFVGFIESSWISFPLLKKISKEPNIDLIIIGPFKEKTKKLLGNNSFFAGIKKNEELYEELKTIDVCIASYNINAYYGITPNKLWLYLTLGKPVVVTNLTLISKWQFESKFVYKANNDEEFINFIYQAFNDDSQELMKRRIEFAKQNSWEKRIEQILALINQYIS